MKRVKLICMMLLAVSCMVSCRGPQGPQGPEGNANVASTTLTVNSNDWYWDDTSWRVDIDYPAIDADINENGAVLVYMENGGTWRQIPLTFYYSVNEQGQTLYCSSSLEVSSYLNGVSIFWTENDFYNGYRPEQHRFKIVAIAASLYSSRPDVDYSNYESVKTAFQIAE